jgi:hypothetical protein
MGFSRFVVAGGSGLASGLAGGSGLAWFSGGSYLQ